MHLILLTAHRSDVWFLTFAVRHQRESTETHQAVDQSNHRESWSADEKNTCPMSRHNILRRRHVYAVWYNQ